MKEEKLKIIGIIFVVYGILLKVYKGGITFNKFWIISGVLFILAYIRKRKKGYILKKGSLLGNIIRFFLLIFIISFIIIESFLIYAGSNEYKGKSDYVLVLGAGLNGEKLSLTLHQRMEKSLEYIKNNPKARIIVSGGQGPGESISESEAMKRYLIKNGIDENRIIKENKSTNTFENFKFSSKIIKKIDNRKNLKVTIVTSDFHMCRSKMLGKSQGFITKGYPSKSHPLLILNYYVREYFALIKDFIFNI